MIYICNFIILYDCECKVMMYGVFNVGELEVARVRWNAYRDFFKKGLEEKGRRDQIGRSEDS